MSAAARSAPAGTRPCVLKVKVDNEIPPMAPHVTKALAEKSIEAIAAGDPQALGVVEKALRSMLTEFNESIPGLRSHRD